MDQEQVWDSISRSKERFSQKPLPLIHKFIQKYQPKPGKILDIGCGNGRNLVPFAKSNFECHGIDFSKESLNFAQKLAIRNKVNFNLKKADLTNLPFKDNSIDYILHIASLHCLKTEKQRIQALKEAYRVLKPNGLILLTVWNKFQLKFLFKPKDVFITWTVLGKPYHRFYHLFTPFSLKRLIKKTSFKLLDSNFFKKSLIFTLKKKP